MKTDISDSKIEMGRRAAALAAEKICAAIAERGEARVIFASAASQFEFIEALLAHTEIDGMPAFVKALAERGIAVSLGHQMAATPAEIEPCLAAGAKAFTHLGNGIPNMIPRHANIVMTALAEDRASVMFIPDGHHLPDTMLKVYCRAVPTDRLIAVSDAQYPAGLPPGAYDVIGVRARLEPDGLLWNPARNCLVGATAPMARMMRLLADRIGLTERELTAIGHDNPLRLIGEQT